MVKSRKKKSGKFEPTLQDVLEAVQGGFGKVENRLDGVENRLGKVENRLDKVENRLGDVEYRMTAVEKRVGSLELTVEDMKDTLNGVVTYYPQPRAPHPHSRKGQNVREVCFVDILGTCPGRRGDASSFCLSSGR